MIDNKKRCLIFGSAELASQTDITVLPGDILISADGGLRHLSRLGLTPDYLIGDMDSLDQLPPVEIPIERYPAEKDDTDTFLAVKKGLSLGCESFLLYGCLGGRLDHTLANLQILLYLTKIGKSAVLLDGSTAVYPLSNGSITFDAAHRGKISVLAFSEEASGVTLKGLKYPLKDAVLTNAYPLGVSNEFIGKSSEISVKQGDLILILDEFAK